MALTLKARNGFIHRIQTLLKLQRFSHAIFEGGLQPQFRRDMHSVSNPFREQCQIEMSKWQKLDSRDFGIKRSMISSPSWTVLRVLRVAGFEAYLVGGCVRDLILNRTPKDFDVITTAKLSEIKKHFHRAHIVGRRFPICRVQVRGSVIEVSSFETVAEHAKKEEKVHFSQMPSGCDKSDFVRWRNSLNRDFTINSLFFDPFVNKIYDYANGMKDLRSLMLRTVVPAKLSFTEDSARMLRGLRIAARLGLSFSTKTETAIRSLASSIKSLDKFRIMLELNYMLSYGSAKPSLCLLRRFNLLHFLLPFHGEYLAQQVTEPSAHHSLMFMKLFFNLDKLVACDRPCDCCLWIGLLAFHMALVNKPQDASVVWTLSSVLYHGQWKEGVEFARKHAQAPVSFSPEILEECDSKSDEELAIRVSELASLVQDCVLYSTETDGLSASNLVGASKRIAEHVADIFCVLVNDIESYEEGRESPEIDYYLLGKGDLRETRFVLGKVIMDTMSCGLVQMETEVVEEKNQLHLFDNEQKAEPHHLSEVVKHLIVAKVKKRLSLFNSELQQESEKRQKLVDMKFDPSEEETAKEKQRKKTQKHQKMAKKLEIAENVHLEEMTMKQKLVDMNFDSSEQETAKEKKKEKAKKRQKMAKKLEIAENVELEEMAMKQNLVDMEFDSSEQQTTKEKKEKTQKHQKMTKKLEIAEDVQLQEMAMQQLKMVGTENLQTSTKRTRKVAKKDSGLQKLTRNQNEQHKLEEAANQKLTQKLARKQKELHKLEEAVSQKLTQKLARKQNEQHKLEVVVNEILTQNLIRQQDEQPKQEEAVNQKLKRPALSSLFK